MNQLLDEPLTTVDVKALAACLYEPEPRLWIGGQWRCPQCFKLNAKRVSQCRCGISRDGLPEFCER